MRYTLLMVYRTPSHVYFRLFVNGAMANSGTNSILCMRPGEFDDFKYRLNAEVEGGDGGGQNGQVPD